MNIQNLWIKYKKNGDLNARNMLIENYIGLVRITAGRLKSTIPVGSVEMDDLISYGVLGLMDAVEKFDINKKVKFETYAKLRIRGCMIDHLRKNDWAPRSMRQKSKEIEKAYRMLENRLGRNPTDQELSAELGIHVNEYQQLLGELSSLSMISLEEMLENHVEVKMAGSEQTTEGQPERCAVMDEMRSTLKRAIDSLPQREKFILTLYYYEELTYKEIGKVLGISESRISQLHSKAIIKLKRLLFDHKMDLSLERGERYDI